MKTKLKDVWVDFEGGFIEIKDGTMNISHDKIKIEFLSELFYRLKSLGERDEEFNVELLALVNNWEEKGGDWREILQYCKDELKDGQSLENMIHDMDFTADYYVEELKKEHRQSCMKNPCLYFKTRHHAGVSKRVAKDIVTEAHDNVMYDVRDFISKYGKGLKKVMASELFGNVVQLYDLNSRDLEEEFDDKWREYTSSMNDEAISRVVEQKSNPEPPSGGQAAEEHGIREAKI